MTTTAALPAPDGHAELKRALQSMQRLRSAQLEEMSLGVPRVPGFDQPRRDLASDLGSVRRMPIRLLEMFASLRQLVANGRQSYGL